MRFLEPGQLRLTRTAGGVLSLAVAGGTHDEHQREPVRSWACWR